MALRFVFHHPETSGTAGDMDAGLTHVIVSHERAEPEVVLDWPAALGATYTA